MTYNADSFFHNVHSIDMMNEIHMYVHILYSNIFSGMLH